MSSIIFIGSPQKTYSNTENFKQLFRVSFSEILFRIFSAFVPPINKKYGKVYVDFQGPLIVLILLTVLVNYGYSLKSEQSTNLLPTETLLLFIFLMPIFCFVLSKLGDSCISLYETISLIGYALYGHLFTLLVSFLCFQEQSDFFFFLCLIFFGGLSTLRVIMVFLWTIPLPAARLLICSLISVINILYLVFLHFVYMHRTFVYKAN